MIRFYLLFDSIKGTEEPQFKGVAQNIVEVASEFFKLLADVLNGLSHELAFS